MKPPFRADHVGSLLRPPALAEARAKARRGELAAEELRKIQDRCIREAVEKQEAIGLQSVTDGEMRRDWWHLDFLGRLDGVALKAMEGPKFAGVDDNPPMASVTGKLRCSNPIMVEDFAFLRSVAKRTPKFTLPAPSQLHLRGGRKGISRRVYPELAEFWRDAAEAYRRAIAQLAAAGCSYLQIDDTAFAYLCDPKIRANCVANGDDPAALPRTYAGAITAALRDRPPGMTVAMHTCRGNFRSAWVAEGGYESVAEAMFAAGVDAFFMEFDTERAGGFEPLRFVPKGKCVVLGLVSTKVPALEEKTFLKKRIEQASRYVPLENLCLSPQCGFSSTHHGNLLTEDDQWRKLELVVQVAREVWGDR